MTRRTQSALCAVGWFLAITGWAMYLTVLEAIRSGAL